MSSIIEAAILLLVIMDPMASLSALVAVSRGKNKRQTGQIIIKAVAVAALVFIIFAVGGDWVLKVLGVSLDSFKVAGGVVLAVLGIQMVLGINLKKEAGDVSEAAVVIGTPLITGPAAIATTMLLVKDIGVGPTLLAGAGALFVVLLCLSSSYQIKKVAGKSGLHVLSTMMGIVTVAWGAQFIISGVIGSIV